jgi:hypothetical protein
VICRAGTPPATPAGVGRLTVVVVSAAVELGGPAAGQPALDEVADALRGAEPAVLDTTDVAVVGPAWQEVTVHTTVAPVDLDAAGSVADAVRSALADFLDAYHGGPDGTGWAFGRAPHDSDLYAVISAVPGVDHVLDLSVDLRPDPDAAPDVVAAALVRSGRHVVAVGEIGR